MKQLIYEFIMNNTEQLLIDAIWRLMIRYEILGIKNGDITVSQADTTFLLMLHIQEHDHELHNVGHDEGILHGSSCNKGYFTNNISSIKYDEEDKRHLIKVGGIAVAYTKEYIRFHTNPIADRAGGFYDIFSQIKRG